MQINYAANITANCFRLPYLKFIAARAQPLLASFTDLF